MSKRENWEAIQKMGRQIENWSRSVKAGGRL